MHRFLIVAFAAVVSSSPLIAADSQSCGSGLVCAADPQTVVSALQQSGFRAELGSDKEGPYVVSSAEGFKYYVMFNDCADGKLCKSLQFNIMFNAADWHTPQYANSFNARYRFAQLSALSDKRLRLAYDVYTVGGLTAENFNEVLGNWSGTLRVFLKYSRENAPPPAPQAPLSPPSKSPAKPESAKPT